MSLTPTEGAFVLCAWLETDSDDAQGKGDSADVVTASSSVLYTVTRPVECVVPNFTGTTLAKIKRRLVANHCGIGRVRRVVRSHVRSGRVVGLSPRPGTRHRAGYRVTITVARHR
ncbi:PASTA domain-containing protein [Solirubrobacter soli]|uniref:PASTA domain-containing protein n=1 Tax=Solirubrobacter soli TaxID=363832 RepID=UPI00352CBE15